MAYSRKRARKYYRRIKRTTRKFARSTGIRAPYRSGGFFGPGYKKRGKVYVELKKVDSGDPGAPGTPSNPTFSMACTTTGASEAIFFPPVGSQINQRIGRRVMVKSIQCRGRVQATDPAMVGNDFVRLLLVLDMQPNSTAGAPGLTDVLGLGANPAVATSLSFNNLNNRSRFKILMDWKKAFITATPAGTMEKIGLAPGSENVTIDYYKKVNFPVTFNSGSSADPGDITTGKIFLLAVGAQASAAAGYTFFLETRVRFIDP